MRNESDLQDFRFQQKLNHEKATREMMEVCLLHINNKLQIIQNLVTYLKSKKPVRYLKTDEYNNGMLFNYCDTNIFCCHQQVWTTLSEFVTKSEEVCKKTVLFWGACSTYSYYSAGAHSEVKCTSLNRIWSTGKK